LRHSAQYRRLFVTQSVSFAGTMVTYVALPYQAYQLSHSSLVVGFLSVAEVVPVVLVGLLGGAMADAFDRRTMVLWSEVGLAACSLVLVANASLWVPRLWPLFVIAVLAATFDSLQRPSLDAMVPRLVPTEDIPAAIVLSNLRSSVGMVAGPALAGGLIALAGLGIAYGLDVATFSVSLLALFGLAAVPPAADAEPLGLARIMEGLRYARSRQDLLGTYAVDMAAMFFGMPQALFPQLATHFGGAGVLGLLYAAPAVGTLVVGATGGWVGGVRRQGRALVFAACGWGLAIVAFGFAASLWVALVLLAVAGGFDTVSGFMRSTIWNQSVPDSLRGRLAGIELISYSTGPSLGNLEAGLVEALSSLRFSIVFGGVACVLATGALAVVLPGLWRYDAARYAAGPPAAP
jgi:MFS family permease